jgi:glycerophosphoryl diester phosphodiesterase
MLHFPPLFFIRLCLLTYFSLPLFAQGESPSLPVSKNKLVVIAHRGAHQKAPENTLMSIQDAIQLGADYVELDLRTSKDGTLILMHDETVDRTTNGKGKVATFALTELKALKVFNNNKRTHQIPTFAAALKEAKGKINIYLDFKDADVEKTWQEIRSHQMENQVVVYVNKIPQYNAWRKVAPQLPLITSFLKAVQKPDQLSLFLEETQIKVLDNLHEPSMVETAAQKGVATWLDIQSAVEGPTSWALALEKGVQGLQTDHPEELIAFLKSKKWRDGIPNKTIEVQKYTPLRTAYLELKDIPYGPAGKDHRLDAFVPHHRTDSTKVVVYIHGGSWTSGDKSEFPKFLIDELVGKLGYAMVSINYRLVKGGQNRFPVQIEDVQKALQFLSENANQYKYDGQSFALIGGSAGAHLAMLYAYGYDPHKQVKTVIELWGPTDLTDKILRQDGSDPDQIVTNFLGEKDAKAPIAYQASPHFRLTKDTGVPTLLIHGGKDSLVDVSQAENLYQQLQKLGIKSKFELYPDDEHGMSPTSAPDVFSKIINWLKEEYPAK